MSIYKDFINFMTQYSNVVNILKIIFLLLIPIIVIVFVYKSQWGVLANKVNTKVKKSVLDILENNEEEDKLRNKKSYFNLDRIDTYLRSHGGYYMFDWLEPFTFIMIKFGLGLLFFIVGISLIKENILLAIIVGAGLAVLGFFSFDFIINIANDSDNDDMLSDIKSIFDTLKIQTKAGVFLSYSLCECYLIVKNARLKAAMLEMTNKIVIKNDIESAVADFNKCFENSYIDTLCITIRQSMESGKSVQILEDLSKQIADMQHVINIREREKMDSKIQFLEIMIFVGLIGAVLYALVIQMMGSMSGF